MISKRMSDIFKTKFDEIDLIDKIYTNIKSQ